MAVDGRVVVNRHDPADAPISKFKLKGCLFIG